jgi:ribosomal protein S27AE
MTLNTTTKFGGEMSVKQCKNCGELKEELEMLKSDMSDLEDSLSNAYVDQDRAETQLHEVRHELYGLRAYKVSIEDAIRLHPRCPNCAGDWSEKPCCPLHEFAHMLLEGS